MESDLTRIRNKAGSEPKLRFTSLYHHVTDQENLRASWNEIERAAAPGVDGITKDEYEQNLNSKRIRLVAKRCLNCNLHA